MSPRHEVDLPTKLGVLRFLAIDNATLQATADEMSLPYPTVVDIASAHGYPEVDRLMDAIKRLQDQIDTPGTDTPPPPAPEPAAQAVAIHGLNRVPLAALRPSPNNPRERLKDIDELAISIRENGLIQPIIAQQIPGQPGYQVIAGHRRLAALKRLGRTDALCIIRRDMLPDAELLAMLVENGQRAGLDPIEEARALNRLRAQGMTQLDIAKKVGRSVAHVSMRLALLALPIEAQEELRAGESTVMESVEAARLAAGRIQPGKANKRSAAHLAFSHPLATRAKARCQRLSHKRGGAASVGGMACGECWESVIRADEREHLHTVSAQSGRCVLCDTVHDPDSNPLDQSA